MVSIISFIKSTFHTLVMLPTTVPYAFYSRNAYNLAIVSSSLLMTITPPLLLLFIFLVFTNTITLQATTPAATYSRKKFIVLTIANIIWFGTLCSIFFYQLMSTGTNIVQRFGVFLWSMSSIATSAVIAFILINSVRKQFSAESERYKNMSLLILIIGFFIWVSSSSFFLWHDIHAQNNPGLVKILATSGMMSAAVLSIALLIMLTQERRKKTITTV
ncbi:MAG: hypothetical protein H6679_00190 [Epsilonproteobacteria bacterium]|nr:hypothetical protein [Campylobacterota bacterium]